MYFLKPAIRQNSYGLYIVERSGNMIMGRPDSILSVKMLSGCGVIYGDPFFIMVVYREKGILCDCLKRSLGIRHSSMIYTFYKYIRVLSGNVKKEMFRQFHTGYRIRCILQTCLTPT